MKKRNNIFKKDVSVIIPTYNCARFITQAIESVLAQTYKDFEIIVVDDGSTDNTKQVLEPYMDKIRYIYQKNQGLSAARNTGIKHARGKYIAFLDSDDLWLPTKLEKQVRILEERNDFDVVYTNISFITEDGRFIKKVGYNKNKYISGNIYKATILFKTMFAHPQTLLVKKKCFDEIGYFDTKLKKSEDRDMAVRLAKRYKVYGIAEPLVLVRVVKGSLGRCSAREREYYRFKFLDKLFNEIEPMLDEMTKKRLLAHYYFVSGLGYLKEMDCTSARERFFNSIRYFPYNLDTYFYLFLTLLGKKFLKIFLKVRKIFLKKCLSLLYIK